MNQSNSSKQVLLSVIGVAILVVAVVGISFAFFNYTRTGNVNTIQTGHIQFNTEQTQTSIANLFPVAASQVQTATADVPSKVGVATVTIKGKTSYADGLDYKILTEGVNLNVGGQNLPLSVFVSEDSNLTNISNNHTYSYNIGDATTPVDIGNNYLLAEGHIDAVAAADVETAAVTNHKIYVKAYLDINKIAITDTPQGGAYGGTTAEPGYGTTTETNGNGTTNSGTGTWQNGRRVYTTAEWNALHGDGATGTFNPVSFKIRVEAIETNGTWTTAPASVITTGAVQDADK